MEKNTRYAVQCPSEWGFATDGRPYVTATAPLVRCSVSRPRVLRSEDEKDEEKSDGWPVSGDGHPGHPWSAAT